MMITLITILFIPYWFGPTSAQLPNIPGHKVAVLPEIDQPQSMVIDEQNLYICSRHNVFVYGLDDFMIKKIFGKPGGRKHEFNADRRGDVSLILDASTDHLVVCSSERVSLFTKAGDFIRSMDPYPQTVYVVPFGDGYVASYYYIQVGTGLSTQNILLFDDRLKYVKEVTVGPLGSGSARGFGGPDGKMHVDLIPKYYGFRVFGDMIFIANAYRGFHIDVYDSQGNPSYNIQRDHEKIPVPEALRMNRREEIAKRFSDRLDDIIIDEKEFLPAFRTFSVTDDRIYVYTYSAAIDDQPIVILNLNGEYITIVHVPQARYACIGNGNYYYLEENRDGEWILNVAGLNP